MRALGVLFLLPLLSCRSVPAPATGKPSVETFQLASKTFGNTRAIRVLLPPGYASGRRTYPVLYLNDGVTVFKPASIDIATVVGDLVARGEIRPLIVVGIDNGGSTATTTNPGRDRANEYLPYPDGGFEPGHTYVPEIPEPMGKLYPTFLLDEVMPAVAQRYRVSQRRADVALGGFSYGGDAALYAVMTHPDRFGALLLESTPLWIGSGHRLLVDAQGVTSWPPRVHIGIGANEKPDDDAINRQGLTDVEALAAAIRKASPKTQIDVVVERDAPHGPASWRGRLPGALRFLFGVR